MSIIEEGDGWEIFEENGELYVSIADGMIILGANSTFENSGNIWANGRNYNDAVVEALEAVKKYV